MCGFYCIAFRASMHSGKALLDCTIFFSPNDHKKSDKTIYMSFKDKYSKRIKF